MNQRQFPASLNRFLTWLMLIAALVAVAVLLATPGVVWGQNPPIAKDTIPIQNLTVGTDLALDVSPFFEDVNNDLLTYSVLSSDETVATVTVTVSSSMVTITPISIGTAIITVTADDGNDGTVGQTFNAVVQAAQAPPTAKDTITTQNLTVGTIGTLDVSPYFDDVNNDPLTYSALSSDDAIATVAVNTNIATITPVSIGTAIITVTADDGNDGTVDQTFDAVVQAVQAPPTAKDTITTQNLTVGTIGTLDVSPYFNDVNNDPLTYSALSSDDAIATVAINTNTATISPISDGTATITVTADDGNSGTGGGTVDQTFQVVVQVNLPPTADAGPDQNVGEGDTVMLDGSGSSDLDGETLTYEWTQTPGTIVQLNDRTSVRPTFIAPAVNRTLTFSLLVTDPQSQTSAADTVDISVAAIPVCTTATVQQSKAVPSATFDLTFAFAGDCRPSGFTDATFTVLLHEDIGVPSGFGKDDIQVNSSRGSFVPNYVFKRSDDDGDEEIEIAGCGQWRHIGASPNSASAKCADVGSLRSIQLRRLTLPSRPAAAAGEPYNVSIQWGSNTAFLGTIDVGATLEIDGDKLVGFGESIKFKGSGFSDGVTANLYAQPGTGSEVCTNAGGGSWTNIGSTNVGSDHRFESDVEISTTAFRSAGKYLVCDVDGAGVPSANALIIEIKVGLTVVGAGSGIEFQPGQQITLSIEGGGSNLGIESILVAGQVLGPGEWQRSGNNIFVTIPPDRAGTFTASVTFAGGQTASVNITIAAFDLLVQGVGAAGIGMGQTAVVSASNLPGDQVCSVTLAGIRLAFLDENRIDPEGCVPLLGGGRLIGNIVMTDQNGVVTPDLIRRLLDSDGEETLEITTSNGAKASAEVKVAKPTITFDPADGEVTLRDIVTIRGANFPPDRNYYNPPNISITIDGRRQLVYPTGTSWELQFEVTNRLVAGQTLRVDVSIDNYPLSELTATYTIKIAPPELSVSPPTLKIGTLGRVDI